MKPLSLSKPHLIIMVGIPGSGKSFFAEHFSESFKAPLISFDKLRKELFDEPTLNREEDEIISRVAGYMLDEALKTKQTILYKGQTEARSDRAVISKKAKDAGYEPLFIWVQTETSTAKKRAMKPTTGKPGMSSEMFDSKLKRFTAPVQIEKSIVISGKHTYVSQLKIVLKHLIKQQPQAQQQTQPQPVVERPAVPPVTRPIITSRNILIR